jgi:AP-1 complex subunit beta-1
VLNHRPEDDASREKALQAVVAGNQAENLLDFDDEPSPSHPTGNENSMVSDGMISNRAIASAAKSTNPLDELMDLFSTASMSAPVTQPVMNTAGSGLDGFGGISSSPSPVPTAPQVSNAPPAGQGKKQDDDLLGLF